MSYHYSNVTWSLPWLPCPCTRGPCRTAPGGARTRPAAPSPAPCTSRSPSRPGLETCSARTCLVFIKWDYLYPMLSAIIVFTALIFIIRIVGCWVCIVNVDSHMVSTLHREGREVVIKEEGCVIRERGPNEPWFWGSHMWVASNLFLIMVVLMSFSPMAVAIFLSLSMYSSILPDQVPRVSDLS